LVVVGLCAALRENRIVVRGLRPTLDAPRGLDARDGGHEVAADHVVLCTNGFVDHTVQDAAGSPILLAEDQQIVGRVAYMAAFVEEEPRTPAARSYIRNSIIGGPVPYVYVTRRTYDRPQDTARLGRSHNSDDTRRTFRYLRDAGFDNVSFDLIAGLPGQTVAGWQQNLDEAFSLMPEHLSFYLLEVHEGTPLWNHIKSGIQPVPDEDLAAEMYEVMLDRATDAGYEHYEISNLSLPGYESRHNTKYWTGAPYYGFGCSAHSYDGLDQRWANERDLTRYMEIVEQNDSPVVTTIKLTAEDRRAEAVFLGLRMMRGFSLNNYQREFGADLRENHEKDLSRFIEAGLIECGGDLLKLTRAGALLSNEVFAAFV